MSAAPAPLRGRFAPSPTGRLHFGSLVAAVGSYLAARTAGGEWLVRIEDLDPPREQPGAADAILHTLAAFGFEWWGEVLYQSRRTEHYAAALDQLAQSGHLYRCNCSRKAIQLQAAAAGLPPGVYPGSCRGQPPDGTGALRVVVPDCSISFQDGLQGAFAQQLTQEVGDFVVQRLDGFYAYQLAVVVDDAAQGVNQVVRGCDLLDNTPRQIWLQRLLGAPQPAYLHLPIAVDGAGNKLSKQTHAPAVDPKQPGVALWEALCFLAQQPPSELWQAPPAELWQWAFAHWDPTPLRHRRQGPWPLAPGPPQLSQSSHRSPHRFE